MEILLTDEVINSSNFRSQFGDLYKSTQTKGMSLDFKERTGKSSIELKNGVIYEEGDIVTTENIARMVKNYEIETKDSGNILTDKFLTSVFKDMCYDFEEERDSYPKFINRLRAYTKDFLQEGKLIEVVNLSRLYIVCKDLLSHFYDYGYVWYSDECKDYSCYKSREYNIEIDLSKFNDEL